LSRVPIRLKLTIAFAAAMAVVLAALGLFVYLRFEHQLDDAVISGLESQAQDVKSVLARTDEESARSIESLLGGDDTFAEVLAPGGKVVNAPAQLGGEVVLSPRELSRAVRGRIRVDHPSVQGLPGRVRLLAVPAEANGRRVVVVVGASLEDRDAAIVNLRRLMLVGGPIALLLASLVGYAVSSAAFRPVERMRRRAATISAAEPSERLPVPASHDELSRLGETLNAMLARLETAIERERRFVDDASHELRTPLAMHKTELELALRYGNDPEELKAAIASAAEEVDRLIQLAEDLLVVARSDKGRLAVNPEVLSSRSLLSSARERFGARAEVAGRALIAEDGTDLTLRGDRLRVEQALTNLIENAFRHGTGTITLRADGDAKLVRIHVTDDGPGFSPELIDHAFDRFTRGDPARSQGGAGLGLAIVEAIATAHGGTVGVTNREGGGADVFIELDAATQTSAAGVSASP
jgi:two-component system, OmpR family, sensor kinase